MLIFLSVMANWSSSLTFKKEVGTDKNNKSKPAALIMFTENKEMSNNKRSIIFRLLFKHTGVYVKRSELKKSKKFLRNEKQSKAEPRLTIVVDDGSHQLVLFQHGEKLQGLGLTEDVAALQALGPSHQVVHLDPCPVVRQLPPSWNLMVIKVWK